MARHRQRKQMSPEQNKTISALDTTARQIDAGAWNRLISARPEDHAYFCGCENANHNGLELGARIVRRGDEIVAACPTFTARFDVPLVGLQLPVAISGIGSPFTDACPIGLAPELDEAERAAALAALLVAPRSRTPMKGLPMIVVKDITGEMDQWLRPHAHRLGFARVPTLPRSEFSVDFTSIDHYLAGLARSDRKYLKHAAKRADGVTVERIADPGPLQAEFYALYCEQQQRADVDSGIFDAIAPDLFATIAHAKPETTQIFVYRVDGVLAGFAFCIFDAQSLAAKYVGFKQPFGKEKKLYFLNWMEILRFCLERGIGAIHVGQNSYPTKVMLGCKLSPNWIYYRHPGAITNLLVRRSERFVRFDTMDEDLVRLLQEHTQSSVAASDSAATKHASSA